MDNGEIGETLHIKWNVPSWRDSGSYEFAKSLGKAKFRWECLRRLPAYRRVWENHGSTRGGFGLSRLIDPTTFCEELNRPQEVQLYSFEARPLGDLLAPPTAASLLNSLDESPNRIGAAEDIGIQVLNLLESGYVLFALNPMSSVTRQLQSIETLLSAMQSDIREDETEFAPNRINEPKVDAPHCLLRVMDAFDQEGILGKSARRGALVEIGKTIFLERKSAESTSWHKEARQSYQLAMRVARSPVAMDPAERLTK